jgi:hypothetical protein
LPASVSTVMTSSRSGPVRSPFADLCDAAGGQPAARPAAARAREEGTRLLGQARADAARECDELREALEARAAALAEARAGLRARGERAERDLARLRQDADRDNDEPGVLPGRVAAAQWPVLGGLANGRSARGFPALRHYQRGSAETGLRNALPLRSRYAVIPHDRRGAMPIGRTSGRMSRKLFPRPEIP